MDLLKRNERNVEYFRRPLVDYSPMLIDMVLRVFM